MAAGEELLRSRVSLGDKVRSLEIHLSRPLFVTGHRLSGVVVLRLDKPTAVRSLIVNITGSELIHGVKISNAIKRVGPFFKRETLLTGRDVPRFASDRVSLYWNAFLRREQHRLLSEGEHTYPFSLPLPGSLPPSCDGKAGRIVYQVCARMGFPINRPLQVCMEAKISSGSRYIMDEPFVLAHSSVFGGKHATGADISVELPSRDCVTGQPINGKLVISNPKRVLMGKINISLDVFDGIRNSGKTSNNETTVDSIEITPDTPEAEQIEADFELMIPPGSPPSVEGTSLLVTWALNVSVDACPPLELQVPVIVHVGEI